MTYQTTNDFDLTRQDGTYTGATGELVVSDGGTITLPTPTAGEKFGVRALRNDVTLLSNGSIEASTSDRRIDSEGNSVFVSDGTEWYLVSGNEYFGFDIPDSVVAREADNNSFTNQTERFGLQIEPSQTWPQIGGEISGNVSGATDAQIYRVSDSVLMGSTDVSGLSAGDTFTIDLDTNLVNGETYNFVLFAGGSSWDVGYYNNPSFPITSGAGNLSIINGARNESNTNPNVLAFLRVGNVGFS